MKKLLALCGALVLVVFILGVRANPGNAASPVPASSAGTMQADGSPLPPPIPPLETTEPSSLRADGSPLPPPIPPLSVAVSSIMVADGSPLPPPIPRVFEADWR